MGRKFLAILSLVFAIIACVAIYYRIIGTIFYIRFPDSTIIFFPKKGKILLQVISIFFLIASIILGLICTIKDIKRGLSIASMILGVVSLIGFLVYYLIFD